MKYFSIIILLQFLVPNINFAQDIIIEGQILNSNKKPIPYTNVSVQQTYIGTVSNIDGKFRLVIPSKYKNANLLFSHIGFQNQKLKINAVLPYNIIILSEVSTEIEEVKIFTENYLISVLTSAYNNIKQNYINEDTRQIGFYRYTYKNANGEYVYFGEAVLDVFKTPYEKQSDGQVKIIKSRINRFPYPDTLRKVIYYGSAHAPIFNDIVKQRISFINPKYFNDYEYELQGFTVINGLDVLNISFKPKKEASNWYTGNIYIEKASHAYVYFNYSFHENGIKARTEDLRNLSCIERKFETLYSNKKDIFFLKHISDIEKIYDPKTDQTFIKTNEYITSKIETENIRPIPYKEQLSKLDFFTNEATPYSDTCWTDYNIILQDSMLNKAFTLQHSQQQAAIELQKTHIPVLTTREKIVNLANKFYWDIIIHTQFDQVMPNNYNLIYKPTPSNEFYSSGITSIKQQYYFGQRYGYLLNKKWSFQWYMALNLNENYFSTNNFGIIYRSCIKNKGRQIFMDAGVSYYFLNSAYLLGELENAAGSFNIGRTLFDANKLNMYSGRYENGVSPEITLRTELKNHFQFLISAGYNIALSAESRLFIEENSGFFFSRKIKSVSLSDTNIEFHENNIHTAKTLYHPGNINLKIGVEIKF